MHAPMMFRNALTVMLVLSCGATVLAQEAPKSPDEKEQTPADKNAPPSQPPPSPGTPDRALRAPSQPSPEEIIKAFEKDRPRSAPLRSKNAGRPTGRKPATASLVREGEYINNAAGRCVRDGAWWTFEFESDSPEAPRPPVRLLPNQQLERLVRETQASGEEIVFVVSGEVTIFESQNYVLVRKALRRRSMGNLHK